MKRIYKDCVSQYAYDVLEGKIVTGELVKRACERHLRDMGRVQQEDFPYRFDESEVMIVIEFSRLLKHTSGPLSGEFFNPDPFQIFILGSIYGWIRKDNKRIRKHRKAYIQLARKNAKSFLIAIIALYELLISGEYNFLGVIAATKRDQAKLIFNMVLDMAKTNAEISKLLKFRFNTIYNPRMGTDAKIIPLGKDSKTEDGFSAALGMIDEYHGHPDASMLDVIASSQGQRLSPLLVIITTSGFDLNSPCYQQEYKYCVKLLNEEVENDEYFSYIAQLDSPEEVEDEANWVKANPLVATSEHGMHYLRGEMKLAKEIPEKRRGVMTKNFNIWMDAKDNSYMPFDKWKNCATDQPIDITGREVFIGVDLSKRVDLTSVGFSFILDDGSYYVKGHSFIPEEVLKEKIHTDRVPYDLWEQQGWLTVTPGAVIDTNYIMDYIQEQIEKYNLFPKEICYDPWSALQFALDMEKQGYIMAEIRQGARTLSEPLKDFRENVYNQELKHDNDPLINFAMVNAIAKADHNGNIILDKEKSRQRIDPVAAIINAHVRAMVYASEIRNNQDFNITFW